MANCPICDLELKTEDSEECSECKEVMHKKCSRQFAGKRYCKKCFKKIRKLARLATGF